MINNDIHFPKMLSVTLIFLAILFFIPTFTMLRIVKIGPFQQSLAIFFFPLVYLIADAITEVYGQDKAIFIVFACYLISLFFSIILMIFSFAPFPDGFENQHVYEIIFKQGPYIVLSGFISIGVSMMVNIRLMAKLKLIYRNKHFVIRSFISSSIGEFIVTGLAYPLIFLKLDSTVFYLMINAYLFKVLYSMIAAYPAKLLVVVMRRIDGIDRDDFNKDFQQLAQSVK